MIQKNFKFDNKLVNDASLTFIEHFNQKYFGIIQNCVIYEQVDYLNRDNICNDNYFLQEYLSN